MRMTIIKAFCTLVISVVIRVTRPGTLNLSMLEKEKVWDVVVDGLTQVGGQPEEALAANFPARAPNSRLKAASTTMTMP